MNFKNPLDRKHILSLGSEWYRQMLSQFWIQQKQWDGDDITSHCLGVGSGVAQARITAKSTGMLAGREETEFFLKTEGIDAYFIKRDGERLTDGDRIVELEGPANGLLKAERIVLNFLSRLSGIATLTADIRKQMPDAIMLLPTRKTLWGALDKKGVAIGGGGTHRLSLADAVLVKENHLSFCSGGIAAVCRKIDNSISDMPFWEIEVENEQEFCSVIDNLPERRPGVIMLDDFSPSQIRALLNTFQKPAGIFLEVSGGITPENIGKYCIKGVDAISSGFLTNAAKPVDFSMRITC